MLTRYLRVRLEGDQVSEYWVDGRLVEGDKIGDLVSVEDGSVTVKLEAPADRAQIIAQEPGSNRIRVFNPDGMLATPLQLAGSEFVVIAELGIPREAITWVLRRRFNEVLEPPAGIKVIEVRCEVTGDAQLTLESDDLRVTVEREGGTGETLVWLPVDSDGDGVVSLAGEHFMITGIHGLPQSVFGVPQLFEGIGEAGNPTGKHAWLAYDSGAVIRDDPDLERNHEACWRQRFLYTITAIRDDGQAAYKDPGVDNETDPGAP